jgi:hypothetical protein
MMVKTKVLLVQLICLILTIGMLESCSRSGKNGVFGSKKRKSSHGLANRYQSRNFKGKKENSHVEKKGESEEVKLEIPPATNTPEAQQTILTPIDDNNTVVQAESAEKKVNTEVAAIATESKASEIPAPAVAPKETMITAVVAHESKHKSSRHQPLAYTPSVSYKSLTPAVTQEPVATVAPAPVHSKKPQVDLPQTLTQSQSTLAPKLENSGTSKGNTGKDDFNNWVLYFAMTQGFLALVLGLKHVFQMLDVPSDAGNSALALSYATIGLLAIHAIVVVALANNFMV